MPNSLSLNQIIREKKSKTLCDTCIIKQMISNGEGCYWPASNGKWEYFLPDVEVNNCGYLKKILKGFPLSDNDIETFNKCENFLPEIAWNGLRKIETKVIQALYEFVLLSTGKTVDFDTIIEVFQEILLMPNLLMNVETLLYLER
jgi:hypothetical protein